MALSTKGTVRRASRQACLLCPWARQLERYLHLFVANSWWRQAVYLSWWPSLRKDMQAEHELIRMSENVAKIIFIKKINSLLSHRCTKNDSKKHATSHYQKTKQLIKTPYFSIFTVASQRRARWRTHAQWPCSHPCITRAIQFVIKINYANIFKLLFFWQVPKRF